MLFSYAEEPVVFLHIRSITYVSDNSMSVAKQIIFLLEIMQHSLRFLGQASAQGSGLQDMHMAAPTEQPTLYLALLAHVERDQQTFRRLFFANDIIRAFLTHPAGDGVVKKHAYSDAARLAFRAWLAPALVAGSVEGQRQQFQLLHTIQAEIAHSLAQMTVGREIPGLVDVDQAIGISLAYLRLIPLARAAVARVVNKTHSHTLNDCPAQLAQPLLALLRRAATDKADGVLQILHFRAQLLWQHAHNFALSRPRGLAVLRVKAQCHHPAAQQEHRGLLPATAQRWQKIAFHHPIG